MINVCIYCGCTDFLYVQGWNKSGGVMYKLVSPLYVQRLVYRGRGNIARMCGVIYWFPALPDSAVVTCAKFTCIVGTPVIIQLADWVNYTHDTPCCYGKATGDNDCD